MSLLVLLAALVAGAPACHQNKHPRAEKPVAPEPHAPEMKKPGVNDPLHGPLEVREFKVLGAEVLGQAAKAPAVTALRKRGLLKAAAPCNRPGLCTRSQYGVSVGFEVELIRKISEWGLGVKENIMPADAAGADIAAAVPCDSSGKAVHPSENGEYPLLAGPYFYDSETGWLCFEIRRGGRPLADALTRILQHFYDTGTFQQVYKNWFPPSAPDIIPVISEGQ